MTATIPGGETHLLFDVWISFNRGNTTYTYKQKDLELKFDFEAGKEYMVTIYATKNEGSFWNPKQRVILAIKVGDETVKFWELGEF